MALTVAVAAAACKPSPPVPASGPPPAVSALSSAPAGWACPMHPEVVEKSDVPCRLCGMKLEPRHGAGAFICPTHAGAGESGAVEVAPGKCARCGRGLLPAAIAIVHDCPAHGALALPDAGQCPLCGRTLLARSAAVVWKCLEHPAEARLEAGKCPACAAALERTIVDLPHGDHNPKHGGIFFMAPDRWHHLEGTLPAEKLFRLHLYDNFTRPLPPEKVRQIAGSLERIRVDGKGNRSPDAAMIPLGVAPEGDVLEARLEDFALPIELVLHLDLGGERREMDRFDFAFASLTSEEAGAPAGLTAPIVVPEDPRSIVAEIRTRARSVRELLDQRALGKLYRPALEAKDLALALEGRIRPGSGERTGAFERGAADVVRGAWLLDLHGDMGDLPRAEEAYAVLRGGVEELERAVKPK